MRRLWAITHLLLALCLASSLAGADEQPARAVDDASLIAVGGLTAVRLLSDNPVRQETGKRMADAVLVGAAAATLLQEMVTSHRPDGVQEDGFPSRHATVAFAAAASLVEREPNLKWIAYPAAAAIGWAREDLGKHTWEQVIGGAAIGMFIGHLAGEGKLHLFGHKDSETGGQSADRASSTQMNLWSVRF